MSKSMIQAFALAQMLAMVAKDNKERLKYTIAGCKDGHLYDHTGQDYGLFNADAPDTVFIPETDLELQRITGVKLQGIQKKAQDFFDKYGAEPTTGDEDENENAENGASTGGEKSEKDEVSKKPTNDTENTEDKVDYDALATACKEAIKSGKIKKATKLLAKLEGQKTHKKLAKKLAKASK